MNGDRSQVVRLALVVAITFIGMLGVGLLPMHAAGGLRCEAPLRGADPKERATEGYLVNQESQACDAKSRSRLTVVGIAGVLYLVVGLGSVLLPESGLERVVFGGEDPEEVYPER